MIQDLTPKEEYDLVTSGEKVGTIAINAKMPDALHDGHLALITEFKRKWPGVKLCVVIWPEDTDITASFDGVNKAPSTTRKYDIQGCIDWFGQFGVDYAVHRDRLDYDVWKNDGFAWGVAWRLLRYNLKMGKGFEGVKKKTEQVVKKWELDLCNNESRNERVYFDVAAVLHPQYKLTYKYRIVGAKDCWNSYVKKFVNEKFSDTKVHVMPTVYRYNGIPYSASETVINFLGALVPDKWWETEEDVISITPKWLEGKTYYTWYYTFKDRQYPLTKII